MHDQFDVTLEDGDLLGEVELTTTLIIAASESEEHLSQEEIDRLLKRSQQPTKAQARAQFAVGESVKVVAGPLSDFSGEIAEVSPDAGKLKVLVSIFGRETPVEVGFDQVKKI